MGPVCESGKREEQSERFDIHSSTDELFWVISKSLTSASNSCNDSVAQVNLMQYRKGSGEGDLFDNVEEHDFATVQASLERSVEDLELALAALEELQRRNADQN